MTEEESEAAIEKVLRLMTKIGERASNETVSISIQEMRGLVVSTRLMYEFLQTTPYQVLELADDNKDCQISVCSRVDIMAAFRRHAKASLTNKCPDCGQPMDTHKEGDHPPDARLN
jgi:hypothetical protein